MAGPAPIDGTELGDLLDDLVDGSNVHAGIRQIASGIRAIATDPHLDTAALQLLLAQLAGSSDGLDVTGAIGHLIEHLTAHTPAVHALDDDQAKTVARQGWLTQHALTDPDLRGPAATACAALDTRREVPPMTRLTDKEREELSRKNAEKNKQSTNRPR
ncbi:hypothetical protein [Streptomyces prasinopilosus]|uniref:hypothetical protein n=1 Tax=Streptomyces prasinopilosus TaxID=67344 RepID=UPI0006EB3C7E|nr:hypothetical protein [Streptomyces prasinopilosus]